MPTSPRQEIACQQVVLEDASVFSIQWSILPHSIAAGLTPEILQIRYLDYIRSCTATLIRPKISAEGVEFRLLSSRFSLLSFRPPDKGTDNNSSTLRIRGGVLVQPARRNRGEFHFGVEPVAGGVKISLLLRDFWPLILGGPSPSHARFWLYRLTQALIHRRVTVRFLKLLYQDLSGTSVKVLRVNAWVADGRPV